MLAGLGGCSYPVDTAIRSTGPGVQGTPLLMWAPEAERAGDEAPSDQKLADQKLAEVRSAVAASLEEKGFRFAEEAPVTLSVGMAQRPGRIALVGEDGAVLSAAQERKGIRPCGKARLTRIGISMIDSGTGQMLYRGSAQETHCRAALDQLLPHLVESVLADIAAPAGDYRKPSPIPN